ncbi:hypothetical protein SAMN05444172_3214 [Burkholderia sp. GAS332]|nr:hypothetical protein SAMN05444172_3214 [Burkholderia sp. GAS332]
MSPLSLTPNVRGHGFQMHHYRDCAGGPLKRSVGELRVGARSVAGSMTALSLALNVREHRFQMHHYRGCAGDPLSRGF